MLLRLRAMPKTAAATALALALAGCAHFPTSIEEPEVEVQDVSLASASFGGVEGQLDLEIFNPNGFGVPLEGGSWELAVGGSRAATGRLELAETIPAKGRAPVVASLAISTTDAIMVGAALASGARDYDVRGRLRFRTRLGSIEVEFRHRGELGERTARAR